MYVEMRMIEAEALAEDRIFRGNIGKPFNSTVTKSTGNVNNLAIPLGLLG